MGEHVKGIIHVHSDFSRDGLCSIADLADFAREAGFQFVGLTDHAEDLLLEEMQTLQQECEEQSTESCVMIPGLEFRCSGDIHILGLGITDNISSEDPVTVASKIVVMGGVAILAHPVRNGYQCPRQLCDVLNGIEIWNAGYDGRFVPPLANLRLLQEARASNPCVLGFGGADLHGVHRPPGVLLQLRQNGTGQLDREMVLDGLRAGGFSIYGRYLSFDANARLDGLIRFPLWVFRKLYETAKAVRDGALGEA